MSDEGKLIYEKVGNVAQITFDNQKAYNALTWNMWRQLGEYCTEIAKDDSVRVVTFRGAGGKAFISGTDITAYAAAGQRKGKLWMGLGIAIAAVALGGAGLFVAMNPPPETAPAVATPEVDAPTPEPVQKRGKLVVTTDPPGAYVRIAGELQGDKTPTTIEKLPLDMDIEVKISREGFEDHVAKVRLGEDKLSDELDGLVVHLPESQF